MKFNSAYALIKIISFEIFQKQYINLQILNEEHK